MIAFSCGKSGLKSSNRNLCSFSIHFHFCSYHQISTSVLWISANVMKTPHVLTATGLILAPVEKDSPGMERFVEVGPSISKIQSIGEHMYSRSIV